MPDHGLDDPARRLFQRLADELAHGGLARLLRTCKAADAIVIDVKVAGVARSEQHGLQVVVHVTTYEPWSYPPGAAERIADAMELLRRAPPAATALPASFPATPSPSLSDLELALLAAARPEECSRKSLVRRAGRQPTSHTYAAIRSLLQRGLLRLGPTGGIRSVAD